MNEKPRALDLFCGAGGATRGLQMAGFHVTGVDIKTQPRYCGDEFHQADAMTFPLEYVVDTHHGTIHAGLEGYFSPDHYRREPYDFIWASPPCQGYSRLRHLPWLKGRTWPKYIPELRARLDSTCIPYCIENVEDAPLRGFILCGQTFGLPLYRHRLFETSFYPGLLPPHTPHREVIGRGRMVNDRRKGSLNNGSAKGAWGNQKIITVAGGQFKKADGVRAMQIDWMTKDELAEAIPPVYSEFIGHRVMQIIHEEAEKRVRTA